jgi:tetratricopeptide (TPR) repeat protein
LAGAAASIDLQLMRAAALLDDDPAAAGREAAKILAEYPGHAAATLLLATARRHCGEVSEATSAFAELAAARPDSALLQLELGRSHAAQGRPADARVAFERAVELEPNLAEAWRELSMLHAAQGETLACDVAYAHYTRLALPEQHLAEAANALANERHAAAESLLMRRLSDAPNDVAAMRLLAEVVAEREDYVEAERLLGECLRLAPGYASARHDLAKTLHSQQKAAPMLPLLERLLAHQPQDLHLRSMQASAYGILGHNERALEIIARLIDEFPGDERVWLSYGHQLRVAGRQPEAIAAYRQCAALKPEFGEAWFSLANLKTFRFTPEDILAMREQLTRSDIPNGQRLQFEFALGKAFEDAGEYADSFAHYARGNALRRAAILYDLSNSTRIVERSVNQYTAEFFAARAGAGATAPDPIFIVGLPRAGSTLLEQILASHSQVEGTRELPDIPGFALELGILETRAKPATYPLAVARFTPAELTALGERYLAQVRPHRVQGRPYFIDKMPSNLMHVGLIHLILPNARIIDARRSPLGCCFANFKQHFQAGNWFSYSLQDLGRYYRDYVHLMAHFDAVLPGRVHRVYYEDIVADLEGEVRRLLEYCGLPFEDGCLRFHENRRLVQTASSEQVRRPIYGDSVDQWRHFEPWLGELKEALGDVVEQYAARPRRST